MHEIMKYFLLTENQQQFMNSEHVPDPANPDPICVILMRSSWYMYRLKQILDKSHAACVEL